MPPNTVPTTHILQIERTLSAAKKEHAIQMEATSMTATPAASNMGNNDVMTHNEK